VAALVLALQLVSAALGTRAADARNACASAHARRCGFRCARAAKAASVHRAVVPGPTGRLQEERAGVCTRCCCRGRVLGQRSSKALTSSGCARVAAGAALRRAERGHLGAG
jgi:hypothetical protein